MINAARKTRDTLVHALFYCWACVLVLIEVGLFSYLSFFSVKPNLILLLVTFYCFYFNFRFLRIVWFCVWCGFLKDAFSGVPPGTHVVLLLCVGMVLRYLSKRFLRYNWIFIIPLFVVATVIYTVFYFVLQRIIFTPSFVSLSILWRISIIELLYGLLIFTLFFRLIKRYVIDTLS